MINEIRQWIINSLKKKEKHKDLRKYKLFKGLNVFELGLLSQIIHKREYAEGEYLFEEKYPLELVFLIESGVVEVRGKLQPGGPKILQNYQDIGFIDMYGDEIRSSSARALKDSVVLAISKRDFQSFLKDNPRIGVKLLQNICISLSEFIFNLVEPPEDILESH